MTIRQQGGIFGRNPTFNDVDVEGTLTVAGSPISPGGTMAAQDANAVAITGGAIDGTTVGATSKTTGAFTTIVGDSATSGYISTLQNTLGSAAGNGLYVQTRYNNATNIVAKFTTNSGTSDVLTLNGDRNMTLHAGNLIIGTSGKGIDFSATSGTGTSELFDDYEEGTWTPALGGTATYSALEANYVKVGALVQVKATILVNTIGTGSATTITGLPYLNGDSMAAMNIATMSNSATSVVYVVGSIGANSSTITMRGLTAAGTTMTIPNIFGNGTYVEMSGSYSTVT
tara:strand:+ start:706 stop:1563 length:858 start_codon:yes stop_codon:yes gene_type:complete